MADFFKKPILNSPYEYPARHWELDKSGQPINKIRDKRRGAEFIYWIPGINNSGDFGRWAFVEFTDVYEIESDFKGKVDEKFEEIVDAAIAGTPVTAANI